MPVTSRVAAVAITVFAVAALASLGQVSRPGGPPSVRTATSARFHLNQLARELLHELVGIDTTGSSGSTTRAAEAVASRLRGAGFPADDIQIVGPGGRKQNLVARYRGTGRRPPVLLLAHADVVDARREDWSVEPFALTERAGFLYGRGTTDMKDMAASFVANLIGLRAEGYRPDRDIIFALTADEEGGDANGVEWLLKNRPGLLDAEICLTEGGGGQIHEGRYAVYTVQAAEKAYVTFALEARDAGGHSAVPGPGNPIYRLAEALTRLEGHAFPVSLNEVTRSFFARMADVERGAVGRDMAALAEANGSGDAVRRLSRLPYYNALLRTTCVPTGIEGGHAHNALPQTARAMINCRLLPGTAPADVEHMLSEVVADRAVSVTMVGNAVPAAASPLSPAVMGAVERVVREMWPGVPVVPVMGTAATDGRLLRRAGIATYGAGPFRDMADNRAHGRDERIGVKQFYEEREFLYRLIKALTGG